MKKSILVVDDEEDTRKVLKLILEQEGYDVITASNGKECLKKLNKNVNLILLDIMMPVLDGWEVIAKMKANQKFRKIPIIILTVKSGKEDYDKAKTFKIKDYIVKPFETDNLMRKVKRFLK